MYAPMSAGGLRIRLYTAMVPTAMLLCIRLVTESFLFPLGPGTAENVNPKSVLRECAVNYAPKEKVL